MTKGAVAMTGPRQFRVMNQDAPVCLRGDHHTTCNRAQAKQKGAGTKVTVNGSPRIKALKKKCPGRGSRPHGAMADLTRLFPEYHFSREQAVAVSNSIRQ